MKREFTEYENENGGTVAVHRVTKDTEGSVLTLDGSGRDVTEGDYLFGTSNPNVFTVGSERDLEGYSVVSDDDEDVKEDRSADSEPFNPSENNAEAVRRYLERQRETGNREEFNRVVAAEQADKNRSTALVEYDR